MPKGSSVQFFTQFCFQCGCMFIRLEKMGAKPILCGDCLYIVTLAAARENMGQRTYAESRLVRWYAEQAAFRQASGLSVSKNLAEHIEGSLDSANEVPF